MSHPDSAQYFKTLIAGLSEKLGITIDASEGMVTLVNDDQSLGMVIELSSDQDCIFVIIPVIPFPDNPEDLANLALDAMLLNADRQALSGACLCADAHRSQFFLIQSLNLTSAPAEFLATLDELTALVDLVKDHLSDDIEKLSYKPTSATFDLHA